METSVRKVRGGEMKHDVSECAGRGCELRAEVEEAKRHVRHLLGREHGPFIGVYVAADGDGCDGCEAARRWCES